MRVNLQLVLCNDDGHEETVTDIVSLNKDYPYGQKTQMHHLPQCYRVVMPAYLWS